MPSECRSWPPLKIWDKAYRARLCLARNDEIVAQVEEAGFQCTGLACTRLLRHLGLWDSFCLCGGFYFEEQVVAADVADRGDPGPVVLALYGIEDAFDFGCFAVGDDVDNVVVGDVHISKHGADILDCIIYLAFRVADIGCLPGGVNRGRAGNEYGLPGGRRSPRGTRER